MHKQWICATSLLVIAVVIHVPHTQDLNFKSQSCLYNNNSL